MSQAANKTANILIIDDEDTVQTILSTFVNRHFNLKDMQCNVRTISDPVQGLFVLNSKGEQFDFILLDVRLPKLTGDEIYNSLLHGKNELLNRILFVTGYPDDLLERFPDLSLNILQKPFRFEDLSKKIEQLRA